MSLASVTQIVLAHKVTLWRVPATIVAMENQQCISELRLSLSEGAELTYADRKTGGRT